MDWVTWFSFSIRTVMYFSFWTSLNPEPWFLNQHAPAGSGTWSRTPRNGLKLVALWRKTKFMVKMSGESQSKESLSLTSEIRKKFSTKDLMNLRLVWHLTSKFWAKYTPTFKLIEFTCSGGSWWGHAQLRAQHEPNGNDTYLLYKVLFCIPCRIWICHINHFHLRNGAAATTAATPPSSMNQTASASASQAKMPQLPVLQSNQEPLSTLLQGPQCIVGPGIGGWGSVFALAQVCCLLSWMLWARSWIKQMRFMQLD